MQLVAVHKATRNRIDITQYDNPRETFAFGELVCQLCGELVMIKDGYIITRHLAHQAICTSEYRTNPESPEHLAGKAWLATHLNSCLSEYTNVKFELEVRIPEVRRVADVMATFPNGWRIAHEVQLATITVKELEERTNDYNKAGIDVWWWFGKSNASSPAIYNWCHQQGVLFNVLNFQYQSRTNHYGINLQSA